MQQLLLAYGSAGTALVEAVTASVSRRGPEPDVATAVDGDGLTITVHFTKKDGAPVHFGPRESGAPHLLSSPTPN